MRRRLDTLPPLTLPDGYRCRCLQPGEEREWERVLNDCGELGHWDAERVERMLAGNIARERIWLICRGDQPVATACVCVHGVECEIGWVAVVPEYQGRRLGAQATLAACHAARGLGFREAFLLTDDFRVPALKTYLNLGFEPDYRHESHPGRWTAIRAALGLGSQE